MKYRVTSGWVTVIGPPAASWPAKTVRTEPLLPRTLPNRTLTSVPRARRARHAVSRSVIRFE